MRLLWNRYLRKLPKGQNFKRSLGDSRRKWALQIKSTVFAKAKTVNLPGLVEVKVVEIKTRGSRNELGGGGRNR